MQTGSLQDLLFVKDPYQQGLISQGSPSSECQIQYFLIIPAISNLYVGSKRGNIYVFEVADMSNKELDSSRSVFVRERESEENYQLM